MRVAIAGYGTEGKASLEYYRQQGYEITVVDENPITTDIPKGVRTQTGHGVFKNLRGYDLVIRTPSLPPDAITTDGKVWSATNEFFAQCPAPIIGVTGSKGKGTTSSLIASILRQAGKTVHLVGNIGVPALAVLPEVRSEDIVVYELSSFQLWDLHASPQVAVVLMIEPDHLDVHANFNEYVAAKAHIVQFQTVDDVVVYNARNVVSQGIVSDSFGEKIAFPEVQTAHVHNGYFWYGDWKLCPVDMLRIPGTHNIENACAAIDAVWRWTDDGEVIGRGLQEFTGLPHRLKFVRDIDDVLFYDDSIATTPGSAIAAMRAFSRPKLMIMGGSGKGADFTELASVAARQDVKKVYLIGKEASKIADALAKEGVLYQDLGSNVSMDEVVGFVYDEAEDGDVVVLSPACASFGMFKNYADRGEQFIAAVQRL